MAPATLGWLGVMATCDALALAWLARGRRPGRAASAVAATSAVVLAAALLLREDGFGFLRLAAWGAFVHGPLILVGTAALLWPAHRRIAVAAGLGAAGLVAVAFDAFLVEPFRLEVTRVRLVSPRAPRPLTILILADLQTDMIGEHERLALDRVAEAKPDLVLLAGDYLQAADGAAHAALVPAFREAWTAAGITAPLGVFAIEGDCEDAGWETLFDGLAVTPLPRRQQVALDGLAVTGLPLRDSRDPTCTIPRIAPFHVVLGHAPDFALGDVQADLLVAGHTHGGQVQIPGLGPILTLSRVPRAWAAGGVTDLGDGRTLVVSRGVGLERGHAPRLRFWCRPQLVVLEVLPR